MASDAGSFLTVLPQRLADAPQRIVAYQTPRQPEVRAHDLAFHGLYYLRSGTMTFGSAAGARRVGAGSMWLLRPFVWQAHEHPRTAVLANCLFDGRLLTERCPGLVTPGAPLHRLLHGEPGQRHPVFRQITPAQRPQIENDWDLLVAAGERFGPGADPQVLAPRLLCLLSVLAGDGGEAVEDPSPVAQAVRIVEQRYREPLSLGEVASEVGVSAGHLSRRFGEVAGQSLVRTIHRLRIEEASRRLTLGDESITAIAAAVGYEELPYFDRCFRRETGMSPRAFRNRQRGAG